MNLAPHDPSILHFQSTHRSKEIWKVGDGDFQKCQHRNPNQTSASALYHCIVTFQDVGVLLGLSIDRDHVICDASPGANMTCTVIFIFCITHDKVPINRKVKKNSHNLNYNDTHSHIKMKSKCFGSPQLNQC